MNDSDLAFPKTPLEQKTADVLRSHILGGQMAQGERLTEQGLARRFDLSPGTVRSALGRLSAEGLVARRPYAGWEVMRVTQSDIGELFVLREALEGTAAMYAATAVAGGADTAALDEAARALERACERGVSAEIADADLNLHKAVVTLTVNSRLIEHYRLVSQQVRLAIAASNRELADPAAIAAEHRPLIAAVLRGDGEEAERLARAHTRDAARLLLNTTTADQTDHD